MMENNTIFTGADGKVSLQFTLGSLAGKDKNKITARAQGLLSPVIFTASSTARSPTKIRLIDGSAQNGAIGERLPVALEVIVTDDEGNPASGVDVVYSVVEGKGNFGGSPTALTQTDSEGKAKVFFTLGDSTGTATAEARIPEMLGLPVRFPQLVMLPGTDPSKTSISGVVIDDRNRAVFGARCSLVGSTLTFFSDENGFFKIENVSPGRRFFEIDGATAKFPKDRLPGLIFDINAVSGEDSPMQMPVILTVLGDAGKLDVSPTKGGTLTTPHMLGFSLEILPGQARNPDGTPFTGTIQVTPVSPFDIPMPFPGGTLSRAFVTIQPPNIQFIPPAQVTFPNSDNLEPGRITDIFSANHDTARFEKVARGKVSDDGKSITSLPDQGFKHGGWHSVSPPPPPTMWALGRIPPGLRRILLMIMGIGAQILPGNSFTLCNLVGNRQFTGRSRTLPPPITPPITSTTTTTTPPPIVSTTTVPPPIVSTTTTPPPPPPVTIEAPDEVNAGTGGTSVNVTVLLQGVATLTNTFVEVKSLPGGLVEITNIALEIIPVPGSPDLNFKVTYTLFVKPVPTVFPDSYGVFITATGPSGLPEFKIITVR